MSFAQPWVLILAAIPLALAVWEARREGHRVRLPFDHHPLIGAKRMPALLLLFNLMPALVLLSAVLLLAGPKALGPPREERVLTNIEICLDVSGSMSSPMASAPDGASRYVTAMAAIDYFTRQRQGDAMGLTIFGGDVVRWCPLTRDTSAIRSATPFLDPETLPAALMSTRVGNALRFCNKVLSEQPEGDRLIILLTDGFSSDLGGGQARVIGNELLTSNITVHAIHVGDGGPPAQLSEVVAPTGGEVFAATNLASLTSVFDHISRMQPIRIKPSQREAIDYFSPFAALGLSALGLYTISLLGLRYTPW